MDNYQELLDVLAQTKDIITYSYLKKHLETSYLDWKEMKRMDIINNRLYQLFLKSIDRESAATLKKLDKDIARKISEITKGTGWFISTTGAIMEDNFINQDDPEFATHDTYTIDRNEMGFYVPNYGEEYNNYFRSINERSQAFLNAHKEQFDELHNMMYEKETIMKGRYAMRETTENDNLPRLISEYLGYKGESRVYYR